ncbi:hypothetical protein D4R87_02320 [bacterium]|nr:MAG: hypothetical protein D4R87_02320 [bacterium]
MGILNLFKVYPSITGLDISDQVLRAVQLKKSGKHFTLVKICEEKLDEGVLQDGEIRDKIKFEKSLKNILEKKKISRNVIYSFPELKTFVKIIDVPDLEGPELKESIRWEAEANIPIQIEDAYLDWEIIERNEIKNTKKVFLSAILKRIADEYSECLENAGFKIVAAENDSIALARALNSQKPHAFLAVNIDKEETILTMVQRGAVRFTSSIQKGNNEDILPDIHQAVDFINEHIVQNTKVEIILSGGSDLKHAMEKMKDEFSESISIGNPWENIGKRKKTSEEDLGNFNVALGLAMRKI